MSADICLIHSSEVDADDFPAGWYLAAVWYGDDVTTDDIVCGPYLSHADACAAMAAGAWLTR